MKKPLALISILLCTLLLVTGCSKDMGKSDDAASTSEQAENTLKAEQDEKEGSPQEVPDVKLPKGGHVEAVKKMPEKPLTFAFLGFQNNPFWFPVRDGVMAAKEYLKNFKVKVDYIVMGDVIDAKTVVSGIETAIAKQYDGIAVTPFCDGTEQIINKAVDSGIPVVTLYGESTKPSKRLVFIGQDCYAAGKMAGELIKEHVGDKGKYGIITGNFTVTPHELRRKGAEDYLKQFEEIKNVGTFEAKDKAELTYSIAKDIITAHPDIKAIYMTAGGPFGAAKAVKDMGKTGEIFVLGYDEVPENLKYVRSGEMTIIGQDPFGTAFDGLVRLYNFIVAGEKPEESFIPSKTCVINQDNVNELFPE